MNEEETIKVWGLIPEFFFDIIARIPPGLFLSILLLCEFKIVIISNLSSISIDFGKIIILILLGYSLGITLSSPAKIIGSLYFKHKWKYFCKRDREDVQLFFNVHPLPDISKKNLENLTLGEYLFLYREMQDFIKCKNFQAKVMLPKLSAECALANNLSIALIFYLIVNILHSYYSKGSPEWLIIFVILTICILLCFIGAERYGRMLGSQFSYLKIILRNELTSQ